MTSGPQRSTRRRRNRRREDRSSVQIIEEAFHLLRTASPGTLWAYFFGTVPFVVAVFYFWADMGRSSYADRDSTVASLGMVGAYFWMKGWQAVFCRRLVASVNPGQMVVFKGWKKVRYFAAQVVLQAFAIPILILSLIILIPFPWTYAFFQNVSALGFSQEYEDQPLRNLFFHAVKLSLRDWGQCVGILIIIQFVALFTWLNLVASIVALSFFAKAFFDFETAFSLNPMASFFNTTFIFGSLLITFLVISPLMKAVFVLRCFYADSRKSGADLLSRLALYRSQKSRAVSTTLAMGILFFSATSAIAQSDITPQQLDDSIRDTMAEKQYQWRFQRVDMGTGEAEEKTGVSKMLDDFAESVKAMMESTMKALDRFIERLFKPDSGRSRESSGTGGDFGMGIQGSFALICALALAGLIGWLLYIMIDRYRSADPEDIDDTVVSGEIDLESESIVATQLHEDEWMKLAREKIAAGETRLAVRALFLASLAHLGERDMLHIKKFKSNRDYSRELELKARTLPALQDAFGENVGLFERVWYGLHQISDDAVQHFTSNYERIAAMKTVHEVQRDQPRGDLA